MILHQCTKNYDYNIFGCRVMAWTDRLFWSNFCPPPLWGCKKLKFVKIKSLPKIMII